MHSKWRCKRGRTDEEGSRQVLVLQPYALEAHPPTRDSERVGALQAWEEMRKE
ncbi:hypothetical protein EXIGLDRAFT_726859 [Exidia glandulosa HHB12029]|uniref:Uncharacterized protein n=1 Tax=Exidia glandulosa HHB12029 TaxID=1314781 RepID=A0A165DK81_EXIGL|nr:hypothetical protein EXIGLDRAFT_726859 [Exidia glandulosa HHB12029]